MKHTFIIDKLEIKERHAGGITILDLEGNIIFGEGSAALRKEIRRLIEEGKDKLLLNLTNVSLIDSSGLGELVSAFVAVSRVGGQIKLLNVTQNVHSLLGVTSLTAVFEIYDDESKALDAFKR